MALPDQPKTSNHTGVTDAGKLPNNDQPTQSAAVLNEMMGKPLPPVSKEDEKAKECEPCQVGCGPTTPSTEDLKIHHMESFVIRGDSGTIHICASGGVPGIWVTDKEGKATVALIIQHGMPCLVAYKDASKPGAAGADFAIAVGKDGPFMQFPNGDEPKFVDLTKNGSGTEIKVNDQKDPKEGQPKPTATPSAAVPPKPPVHPKEAAPSPASPANVAAPQTPTVPKK